MPRTQVIMKEVYQFDELDERAKERARDWYRSCIDTNDYDSVIEDFQRIAEIIGIDFKTHQVQLMSGKTRSDPNIWWSGFCSQGDGACFEGTYSFKEDSCLKIREYCNDEELIRIVTELNRIQTARTLLDLPTYHASIEHSGRYYHEHSCDIEVHDDSDDEVEARPEDYGAIEELMRDLMRWLYKQLDAQNDYLYSKENVDECIEANEYEFTEDGEIA